MFCKKCGTEQQEGQKFCPNCGEPYLDENGKPYEKGFIKDLKDAKDKIVSKAEEISQQGQRLMDEKIQPQLNEKVEELKNADWKEKKENLVSYLHQFIHDTEKMDKVKKVAVCLFVLWFFAKVGFSASIMWYVIIGALVYIAFKGIPKLDVDASRANYLSLLACGFIMVVTAMTVSSGSDFSSKESLEEDFLESIEDPSTAYAVRIDQALMTKTTGPGPVGGVYWTEVPEGEGDDSNAYVWTLIFFPKNDRKTEGRALIELWLTNGKEWADGRTMSYRYMIRDGLVELYNGSYPNSILTGTIKDPGRPNDRRFFIEKENGKLQLRGDFRGKERLLKRTTYNDAEHKENH